MNVIRVHDATGSHIEPPLDHAWDESRRLEWNAAVVTHDTGIVIAVSQGPSGYYSFGIGTLLNTGQSSAGEFSYCTAWTFLTGFSIGAEHVRRRADVRPEGSDG